MLDNFVILKPYDMCYSVTAPTKLTVFSSPQLHTILFNLQFKYLSLSILESQASLPTTQV